MIPRAQREYIALIAERGKLNDKSRYYIHCSKLANILDISEPTLFNSLSFLEDVNLVYFNNDRDEYERRNFKYTIIPENLNMYLQYIIEKNFSLRKAIVALDFSPLEE